MVSFDENELKVRQERVFCRFFLLERLKNLKLITRNEGKSTFFEMKLNRKFLHVIIYLISLTDEKNAIWETNI